MTGKVQVCTHDDCTQKPVARRLCSAHYQAAWKEGALGRHQKAPARPRKRTRCPEGHKHADASTCFIQHQCRCTPCVDAHNARERNRTRLKAYGQFSTGLVDVAPVREHVLMLGEFGIGYKRVAELAGFKSSTQVRTIIWGRMDPGRVGELQKRVKRETAERILAVLPVIENLGSRRPVSPTGAHRRVQALVVRGWSFTSIATRLGWTPANFWQMLQRPVLGAATHLAIAALYEELWDKEPPHEEWHAKSAYTRSLNYAKARGWLPPLAWDDIDTDPEPAAEEVSEQTKGERFLEDVDWLVDAGESAEQIVLSLGRRADAIARLASRHGRRDLARIFEVLAKVAA